MTTVLILGATSTIARAIAGEFAAAGSSVRLAGRDRDELNAIALDLNVRHGAATSVHLIDLLTPATHDELLRECLSGMNDPADGVVVAFGYLGDQTLAQSNAAERRRTLDSNFVECVSILEFVAAHFEQHGGGWICALSSVAGDRGRQSNYVYGAAKAGLTTYLQGLRNRLHPRGVSVITVKLGIVDTQMTFGLQLPTAADPGSVARSVVRAIQSRRDVVYVPWIWRWILLAIRCIPERFFKRMRL